MAVESKIEWTDVTWNPWVGCTAVSEGCHPCYANVDQTRKGKDFSQVTQSAVQTFYLPLQRGPHDGFAVAPGNKVFTGSLMDFFHADADAWRAEVWNIIRQRPDCAFQILTKRTERIKDCLPADWGDGYPNVWLVASVENMKRAKRRIPELTAVPAVIHGLSCEPLLGPLDLDLTDIEWVIGGGQSDAKVKPMQLAWARSLRDQCQDAGVPFFFKQWGQFSPEPLPNRKKATHCRWHVPRQVESRCGALARRSHVERVSQVGIDHARTSGHSLAGASRYDSHGACRLRTGAR